LGTRSDFEATVECPKVGKTRKVEKPFPEKRRGNIVVAGVGRFGAEPPNILGGFLRKNLFGLAMPVRFDTREPLEPL